MIQALALHDSVILHAVQNGGTVRLTLQAIVHESWGTPGADAGEVWIQQAQITMTGVTSSPLVSLGNELISDGSLRIGRRHETNLLPLPIHHTDTPELVLVLANGTRLAIVGKTIQIELGISREYLQQFGGGG